MIRSQPLASDRNNIGTNKKQTYCEPEALPSDYGKSFKTECQQLPLPNISGLNVQVQSWRLPNAGRWDKIELLRSAAHVVKGWLIPM